MSYISELAMRKSDAAESATMNRLSQPEPAQLMSSLNQFRQAVAWIRFLKFKLGRIHIPGICVGDP
jgi:hypothetical protein